VIAFSSADTGSSQRPRVLLADDHPAMLALTADALAGECLAVGRVGDGCELLVEAERLHPDVIVLDITMPRLDGIEASAPAPTLGASLPVSVPDGPRDPDFVRLHSTRAESAMSSRRGSLRTS
jgi:DNA-binding NarL/FixJ family response regulator